MLGNAAPQPNTQKPEQKEELKFISASFSVQSEVVSESHKENQDTIRESESTFSLADGVGGYKGGKTASQMGTDYIFSHIDEVKDGTTVGVATDALSKIVISADLAIKESGEHNPDLARMGTTVVVAKIFKDFENQYWALLASVGNSRVYVVDQEGDSEQLNDEDDFFTNQDAQDLGYTEEEAEKLREEAEKATKKDDLSDRGRFAFNNRNVVGQILGRGKAVPHISVYPIKAGDRILLVSDFFDNFSNQGFKDLIKETLKETGNFEDIPKIIVRKSQEASKNKDNWRAKSDDMSVVLVRVE